MAEGRRARIKTRVSEHGVESLAEHEVLEYLLFPHIPRRDVNPLAHALIADFGGLKAVLQASADSLLRYKGMTEAAALYLSTHLKVSALAETTHLLSRDVRNSPASILEFIKKSVGQSAEESFVAVALDSRGKVKRCKTVSDDERYSVTVNIKDLVAFALAAKANMIVIGHNHPEGDPFPGDRDIRSTVEIIKALNGVKITFADHIIVAGNSYFSFRQEGLDILENLMHVTAATLRSCCTIRLLSDGERS